MKKQDLRPIPSRAPAWLVAIAWSLAFWAGYAYPAHAAESDAAESAGEATGSGRFISFQTFQTHSRMSFRIDATVPVEWNETPQGFSAFFKGSTLVDFGAPFGDEERWTSSFASLRNTRLASIRFRETSGGVRLEGTWKFAKGPAAPAEPRMETFNYRENNPPRFVVDFWLKPGATIAEVRAKQAVQAKQHAALAEKQRIAGRTERKLASAKQNESLDDLAQACREPLQDGRDAFLPYRPVHAKLDFVKFLPTKAPDEHFAYFRPTGDAPDAQYVRLALDLYKSENFALVIRTLDFLDAEHPKSDFRQEMSFLRANALLKLGMKIEGERALAAVRLDAKGTPAALHAALYLAVPELAKNSPLATQETFSWLIQNYPGHQLAWVFHMAVAEALYDIEQTERSAKEYQWVVENAPEPAQRAQAAFRIGDLYLKRWDYQQALGAYVRAMRFFPQQAEANAAVYLNRAEALIGLQQYDDAQSAYQTYLKSFATYPEGWRATLRLGEIEARRPGEPAHAEARKWFYDTINRYPFSPGATISRLRLLPCDDHGGFTAESAVRFFGGEAKAFEANEMAGIAFSLTRYPELRAQSRVRSLIGFGQNEAAMAAIVEERPNLKSSEMQRELAKAQQALFRRAILAKLHGGKPEDAYSALAFYEAQRKTLVSETPGVPDYLLELSHAAAGLGLGKVATELAVAYHNATAGGRAVASASAAGGELEEKLKLSDQRFAEAEALWIQRVDGEKNEKDAQIRAKLDQVVSESRFALEKEVILGLLEESRAKPANALAHVAKAELLAASDPAVNPAAPPVSLRRLRLWLASLQAQAGDPGVALDVYAKAEKAAAAAVKEESVADPRDEKFTLYGMPALPTREQILMTEGEMQESRAKWGEAAKTYARAVDAKLGGNRAMFGLARALLKTGGRDNRAKALTLLEQVSTSKQDDFWKSLAVKTLETERGSGASS